MANVPPEVDLNGESAGNDTSLGYSENDPVTAIAPGANATDSDSPDLEGGSLTVAFTSGGTTEDQLGIANPGFGQGQFFVDETSLYYQGVAVGTLAGGTDGTPLVATFSADVDADIAQADTILAFENAAATGSLFDDNGSGADSDPDGPALAVEAVSTGEVGETVTLDSGAKLTVNSDGSYTYDPDGRLNWLTDSTSGAVNTFLVETFQYTLTNGDTVTATVIVQGVAGPGDWLMGDETDNVITGTGGPDLILLQQGGNDTANAGGGNDIIYFGGAFTRRDVVNGGDGRDVLVLQGNYFLTLSATNLTGVEALSLQTGANTKFGDDGESYYSYDITTDDANVAAGQQLIVNGSSLRDGEPFFFDGSAERDGSFLVFGGGCDDWLEGGDRNDVFVFEGDSWGWYDFVDGGAGRDALVITSTDDELTYVDFIPGSIVRVESISVANRYSSDPSAAPSYEFVLHDGIVDEGDTLIVNGSSLDKRGQTIVIDGSDVLDANLILFGGVNGDTLIAGAGTDLVVGGGGQDDLTGGAGADVFRFDAASDTDGDGDTIHDFEVGLDLIDLRRIDADEAIAGDQAFHWIGNAEFTGESGVLRAYQVEGGWFVEGDTDGDGEADLALSVVTGFDFELGFADFLP